MKPSHCHWDMPLASYTSESKSKLDSRWRVAHHLNQLANAKYSKCNWKYGQRNAWKLNIAATILQPTFQSSPITLEENSERTQKFLGIASHIPIYAAQFSHDSKSRIRGRLSSRIPKEIQGKPKFRCPVYTQEGSWIQCGGRHGHPATTAVFKRLHIRCPKQKGRRTFDHQGVAMATYSKAKSVFLHTHTMFLSVQSSNHQCRQILWLSSAFGVGLHNRTHPYLNQWNPSLGGRLSFVHNEFMIVHGPSLEALKLLSHQPTRLWLL